MNKQIQLSETFSIPALDYAIQGNALLGIKESGKTYTATKIAEELLDAGIPFIAFDPIGVWKYLRVGQSGKGYPVVIAGRDADLPLTPESVEGIIRASMRENIPLVLDLYSVLNKTFWRKIVETAVLTLLMENAEHGLRHIFIEEAAEFCPQKLGRSQFDVYSAIESLARMGGNVSLGYTLINQRAEDVNKSVLEICERMILHRQTGKNSLKGIEDWFKVNRSVGYEAIMNSLPSLPSGECWVCARIAHEPTRIKVAEKKTVHPNRRDPKKLVKNLATDVSKFVERLNEVLQQEEKRRSAGGDNKTIKQKAKGTPQIFNRVDFETHPQDVRTNQLLEIEQKKVAELKEENTKLKEMIGRIEAHNKVLLNAINMLRETFKSDHLALQKLFSTNEVPNSQIGNAADDAQWDIWRKKFHQGENQMLDIFISKKHVTRDQLIVLMGKSRETVRIYVQKLIRVGLVKKEGNEFILQEIN